MSSRRLEDQQMFAGFGQKQPSRGILKKSCSENKQQIYRTHLIEIIPRHTCSPVNLLHIFRTPFTKNTSG